MPSRSIVVGFLWRFVLLYGLLIAPWPGFTSAYGGYFRALGQMVLAQKGERISLRFEAVPAELHHVLDTRILVTSRDQVDRKGSGPVYYLELDTRGVGWVPTALLLALICATPITLQRRGRALFFGLLLIHGYILFSVGIAIANSAADLSLITLSRVWRLIVRGLDETFISQMGASFVVPVLVWILVTVRWQDLTRWQGRREKQDDRGESRQAGTKS